MIFTWGDVLEKMNGSIRAVKERGIIIDLTRWIVVPGKGEVSNVVHLSGGDKVERCCIAGAIVLDKHIELDGNKIVEVGKKPHFISRLAAQELAPDFSDNMLIRFLLNGAYQDQLLLFILENIIEISDKEEQEKAREQYLELERLLNESDSDDVGEHDQRDDQGG